MERLLFGTAGTPAGTKGKGSIPGIERIYELGLDCMELQFLHDVRMGERTARRVNGAANKRDIKLSVHAPYYIDLNVGGEKFIKYREMVMDSARVGDICGAKDIVIHAASCRNGNPADIYRKVKGILERIIEELKNESLNITLRIETAVESSRSGDLDEVLALAEVSGVLPCIDFPHLHARTGRCNSGGEFARALAEVEARLGREGLDNMYVHALGLELWERRRKNNPATARMVFRYKELAQVFSDFDIKGMVFCQNQEGDALALKNQYENLRRQH